MDLSKLKFDDKGLIPAIVQDVYTNEVLMLAYMNGQSIEKTLETKTTWFFSRSRNELWNKGATSGNTQQVVSMSYDCDADTILLKVIQKGNACHTGERSCFFNSVFNEPTDDFSGIIYKIYNRVVDRRDNPKEGSYTNYLFDKGIDKILKKVGEETAEVIIASKNEGKDELIYESCDLIYHMIVLLIEKGVSIDELKKELNERYSK